MSKTRPPNSSKKQKEIEQIKLFPLAENDLYNRNIGVFESLNRGEHATLVGLPSSGRSAFLLASMMQCNMVFKKDFDFEKNIFISIDALYKSVSTEEYIAFIVTAISKYLGKDDWDRCIDLLNKEKSSAALEYAIDKLKSTAKAEKIKFILALWGLDELTTFNPEHLKIFNQIISGYSPTDSQLIGVLFVLSPSTLYKISPQITGRYLSEGYTLFPMLNQAELDYTRTRMEILRGFTITDSMHLNFSKLSAGHYGLYSRLFNLNMEVGDSTAQMQELLNEPTIETCIGKLLEAIDLQDSRQVKIGQEMKILDDKGKYYSPLLRLAIEKGFSKREGLSFDSLTPQQMDILSYLKSKNGKVVSREDLAKHIWGELWSVKYSEWAIDKQITAIRKALNDTKYTLTSIRGKGIKLSSLK